MATDRRGLSSLLRTIFERTQTLVEQLGRLCSREDFAGNQARDGMKRRHQVHLEGSARFTALVDEFTVRALKQHADRFAVKERDDFALHLLALVVGLLYCD